MNRICILLIALVALLGGCDKQATFDKFVPKDEAEFSKRFLSLFVSKDFAEIEQLLDPSLRGPTTRTALQQVADQFPQQAPKEIQILGANTVTSSERTTYDFTLQYVSPDKWLLASVVLQKQGGHTLVTGVHVNPLKTSLQQINAFTLQGKGLIHYMFLVLAVAVPVFVLGVLVLCIRTQVPRRKWLWVLFIILGFVQFSLNWTDGTVNVMALSFLLFGAGFFQAGPAAPYILTVALPIGAMLFLMKRRGWVAQSAG